MTVGIPHLGIGKSEVFEFDYFRERMICANTIFKGKLVIKEFAWSALLSPHHGISTEERFGVKYINNI